MSTLALRNLSKVFPDGTVAVHGIDLDIADGEFLAIVGPSGCGKTSVLRMVAGLEEVTSGDVVIDGARVNDVHPRERNVAMAFQQHALYPHMSVAENLGFSLRMAGLHRRTVDRRVAEIARLLALSDVLERSPGTLSGGQQQRVSMGRAIIRTPRLLLMDEPMSNLDAKLRTASRAEITRIQRRLGITTLYVTHDQVEAMSMADRIVIMRDGRVVQSGPPCELYDRPVDVFVAQFIGSPPMPLVEGGVADSGGRLELRLGVHRVARLADRFAPLVGKRLLVGLRPEALAVRDDGVLLASVESVEHLGHDQLVRASIDVASRRDVDESGGWRRSEEVPTTRTHVSLHVPAHDVVSPWEPLRLRVDPETVHLFDPDTGRRLDP